MKNRLKSFFFNRNSLRNSKMYSLIKKTHRVLSGPPPLYFESYSQFGEDVVMRSFMDGRKVFYVDIGSGHPVKGSNTYFLYLAGYNGILIDPLKLNIDMSRKLRPLDKSILAGASSTPGLLEFYEFNPYQFSTFDYEVFNLRLDEGIEYVASHQIDLITVKSLGLKNDSEIQFFLSIDTEGFEMEVLNGIDFSVWSPDLIVIEDWGRKSPSDHTEIFDFLSVRGYLWNSRVNFSDIYIRGS